ncbi:MAG: cysteine synthase family protein [Acidobacteriota bacterium]|nr:cysteine synthase family protein [Blastocatellia bacterium]MDW8411978.1 cysteine synthase family protein [Acidobacteriota bacterium]
MFKNSKKLLDLVGWTPLIKLEGVSRRVGAEVYAKAEWYNPGGSVKDRPALNMIMEGIRSGRLTRERVIIDATSGNTGISYAWIGAALGYKVTLCIPANASNERKRTLLAYGADLIYSNPFEGTDGAINVVRSIVEDSPEKYFYPDQYNNDANWLAHYHGTANEIWEQTGGRVTHFVAGLGTSGTFIGTSRRLKELKPEISVVSVQPDGPFHGLEGLKHMPTAIKPGIYDPTVADDELTVSTEEAYRMARELAREEGLFVGVSAAANVLATERLARECGPGVYVTILCDGGAKYVNDRFWDEK